MFDTALLKPIAAVAVVIGAFFYGVHYSNLQHQVVEQKQAAAIAELTGKSNLVTERVVIQYKDKIKYITNTKVQYVDKITSIITPNQDANCTIPTGFISVHNNAAQGLVPPTPSTTDGDPSHIDLSTVATTVATNYLTCNQVREQLISLQAWIAQQQALTK